MCSPSTSDVRFITFVNTTYIEAEGLEAIFDLLLKIEVGFLVFSWIEFLYLFYLFIFIRSMHFNLTFLFMNYGGQYFCSMLSRCIIVYQQLGNDPNNDLHNWILVANFARTVCLFIAMYILPIFMIERCLASFFVKNYEKSRKIWVSLMILSIFHPLVFASAIAYIQCWIPVVVHVISFFIVNIIGYIGIHICYSYNIKKHRKFYSPQCISRVTYGLSERFQLAENIKMCKVLKKVQISILFFNIGCCSILLMDHFQVKMMIIYWSYVCFNFFALVYGITVPIILYSALPEWQKETRRLLNLCIGRRNVGEEPKSTFGEQMIYNDHAIESNIYFTQFNKTTH
ncbi:Serpentine receptor class epsilon-8 [Caenorhabditis elegans]|uniref:Serpentine receptor class epsilon-8 n=1 Tax=Caenorhabditis elegans TaxID=6239 RepID=SRE8_CAEEL|nr:Serpentine receptor class epsilon-8 [Caenorhabditis elegans]Q20249.1 RecName: Full=Serpentine receptor class epsilon-8; Short=Protein sre-8 [Caenorhabditis elegans]CAB01186.1 Serpentine receptor class epsilon-8 [Caenorhabditis elegans]|eukprot:NP_506528.1 Serpentine receptor class epsilon-8 [Caenorhabditis elegans]